MTWGGGTKGDAAAEDAARPPARPPQAPSEEPPEETGAAGAGRGGRAPATAAEPKRLRRDSGSSTRTAPRSLQYQFFLVIQTNCKRFHSFLGPYINSCDGSSEPRPGRLRQLRATPAPGGPAGERTLPHSPRCAPRRAGCSRRAPCSRRVPSRPTGRPSAGGRHRTPRPAAVIDPARAAGRVRACAGSRLARGPADDLAAGGGDGGPAADQVSSEPTRRPWPCRPSWPH